MKEIDNSNWFTIGVDLAACQTKTKLFCAVVNFCQRTGGCVTPLPLHPRHGATTVFHQNATLHNLIRIYLQADDLQSEEGKSEAFCYTEIN